MTANTTAQGITTATEEKTELVRCACSLHAVEIWTGEVPEGADPGEYVEYDVIPCARYTTRTFAPGHDAKLKSLLIKAGAAGHAVRTGDVIESAVQAAARYGFDWMVEAGIGRAQVRQAAKAEKAAEKALAKVERDAKAAEAKTARERAAQTRAANKAADKAAREQAAAERQAKRDADRAAKAAAKTEPETVEARIKVGRWEYVAQINTADNTATYTSADGTTKTAAAEKWTMVVTAA